MKKETGLNMPSSPGSSKTGPNRLQGILLTVLVLSVIALHLRFSWNRYNEIASSEAIMLAESVESVIHPEHILELSGSKEDTAKPEYIMTKLSLSELVKTTNPIRLSTLCPNETAK